MQTPGLQHIEVIESSQVKKGTKIYDHGISLERAASILGISQWELSSYIGNTIIDKYLEEGVPLVRRMKHARELFRC